MPIPMQPRPRLILLDADGVLWRGGTVIPQAPGFIRRARAAGMGCALISNNAGPDRDAYSAKCRRLRLDFAPADIFSTNSLAGPYIARRYPGARVLVLGSAMLAASVGAHVDATHVPAWLEAHGIGGQLSSPEQLSVLASADFDAVLLGIDINASYSALSLAAVACQRGARLIACNDDLTFPFEAGMTLPGNGSFVSLVATVAGVEPERLGKPEPHMLEQVELETGVSRTKMVLVGDRVETDIVMAQRAGIPAFLVLTGVTDAVSAPPSGPGLTVVQTLDDVALALGI